MTQATETKFRVLSIPREGEIDLRSAADIQACEAIVDAWSRCKGDIRWGLLGDSMRYYRVPHFPRKSTWMAGPGTESVSSLTIEYVEFRAEKFGFYNMHFIAVIGRYGDADLAVQHERTR
jgi:hypothetical protein